MKSFSKTINNPYSARVIQAAISFLVMFVFLPQSLDAMTKGPNVNYEMMGESETESDDKNIDGTKIKNGSIIYSDLMVPGPELMGGEIIFLMSYQREKFDFVTEENGEEETLSSTYESLPLGFVWVEAAEENRWIAVYKRWMHPSFEFRGMNEFVVGRSIDASFLKFGSFQKVSAYLLARSKQYVSHGTYNLILQSKLENEEGEQIQFDITLKGPAKIMYSVWSEDSYFEAGIKVMDINSQVKDSANWKTGYHANIFASYGQRIGGPAFAKISAGVKLINTEFLDETTGDEEAAFTQSAVPFVGASVETWF